MIRLDGSGHAFNLQVLNFDAGIGNSSANANIVFNPYGNDATNIEIGDVYFGTLNGTLNGNQVFGTGEATSIQIENTANGLGNLSGNANVVGVGNCTTYATPPETLGAGDVRVGDTVVNCGKTGDSKSIIAENTAFGNVNGSLNGNSVGAAGALLVETNNTFNGDFNGSLNGNGGSDDPNATNKAIIIGNVMQGEGNGSGNGNGAVNVVCTNPNDPTTCTVSGGTGKAIIKDNFLAGTDNAAGNGSGYNGLAVIKDNTAFGDSNLNSNGNGDQSVNGDGEAIIKDNFVAGADSGSDNGNSTGGGSGKAIVVNNTIFGADSGSDNGNNDGGDGSAHVTDNFIVGDDSGSYNYDHVQGNAIIGSYSGSNNGDYFNYNTIIGSYSGDFAGYGVEDNVVFGSNSGNGYGDYSNNNYVLGNYSGNDVTGENNIAIGTNTGNNITASNTVAIGTNAQARGDAGIAIGDNAYAAGPNDTALGANASVTADHSTALGADAQATESNQVAIGTKNDTYTTPGITSKLSRERQSGPLQVVTSDANGNLATDNGEIFKQLDKNREGVALALAAVNPDLTGNERFGVSANWGGFDGANAFGMGFEGVLGHNFITQGDRVAVTGGFGVGFADGEADDVWGGRVGAQWTWGAAPAPVGPVALK